MSHMVDVAALSPRAQHRIATACPAILWFAAMQPGGIREWAEGFERDGHGRIVPDVDPTPGPYDDELVSFGVGRL